MRNAHWKRSGRELRGAWSGGCPHKELASQPMAAPGRRASRVLCLQRDSRNPVSSLEVLAAMLLVAFHQASVGCLLLHWTTCSQPLPHDAFGLGEIRSTGNVRLLGTHLSAIIAIENLTEYMLLSVQEKRATIHRCGGSIRASRHCGVLGSCGGTCSEALSTSLNDPDDRLSSRS